MILGFNSFIKKFSEESLDDIPLELIPRIRNLFRIVYFPLWPRLVFLLGVFTFPWAGSDSDTGSFSLKKENFWEIVNEERDDRDRRTVPGEPAGQNRPVWLPDDRLCAVWVELVVLTPGEAVCTVGPARCMRWNCGYPSRKDTKNLLYWDSQPQDLGRCSILLHRTTNTSDVWSDIILMENSKSEYHQFGTWTVLAIWHHVLTM